MTFSFKFHEDPFTIVRARVVNAHVHVLLRVLTFTTRASVNLNTKNPILLTIFFLTYEGVRSILRGPAGDFPDV